MRKLAFDSPVSKVGLLRENNRRIRFIGEAELECPTQTGPTHMKPIIITATSMGMRKGEALKIR